MSCAEAVGVKLFGIWWRNIDACHPLIAPAGVAIEIAITRPRLLPAKANNRGLPRA